MAFDKIRRIEIKGDVILIHYSTTKEIVSDYKYLCKKILKIQEAKKNGI